MESKEKEFIQNSNIFIVTDNKLDRGSWKKALNEYCAKPTQIEQFEDFEQALQKMEGSRPAILICAFEIKEKTAEQLLEAFRKVSLNKAESLCIMLSESEDESCLLAAHEHGVDGVVKKPFAAVDVNAKLQTLLKEKAAMTKFEIAKHKAFESLWMENYEYVSTFLKKAEASGSNDSELKILKAQYLKRTGNCEQALALFKEATASKPDDYHCHAGLFDLLVSRKEYEEAFKELEAFMQKFPLHPKRLQSFIQVSIMTKNYQAIMDYAKNSYHLALSNKAFGHKLAAGLAICAKSIGSDNRSLATEANVKAVKLGRDKKQIVEMGLKNLLDLREFDLVKNLVEELSEERELEEVLSVAGYRVLEKVEKNPSQIFKRGMDLTNKGIHDFHIYDLLLRSAIKVGRKKESLIEMADNACKHHPEKKAYFKSLLAG